MKVARLLSITLTLALSMGMVFMAQAKRGRKDSGAALPLNGRPGETGEE